MPLLFPNCVPLSSHPRAPNEMSKCLPDPFATLVKANLTNLIVENQINLPLQWSIVQLMEINQINLPLQFGQVFVCTKKGLLDMARSVSRPFFVLPAGASGRRHAAWHGPRPRGGLWVGVGGGVEGGGRRGEGGGRRGAGGGGREEGGGGSRSKRSRKTP